MVPKWAHVCRQRPPPSGRAEIALRPPARPPAFERRSFAARKWAVARKLRPRHHRHRHHQAAQAQNCGARLNAVDARRRLGNQAGRQLVQAGGLLMPMSHLGCLWPTRGRAGKRPTSWPGRPRSSFGRAALARPIELNLSAPNESWRSVGTAAEQAPNKRLYLIATRWPVLHKARAGWPGRELQP